MKFTHRALTAVLAAAALALSISVAAPAEAQSYPGQFVGVSCPSAVSGASVSFTNASPTVGTWASPPWAVSGTVTTVACPINITANAPTGLSTATNYWIVPISLSAGTFYVASSAANALAGTYLGTTGTSSTANLTSNLALTTTAGLPVVAAALPAGDWDCQGHVFYVPATSTSVTNLQQGIAQTATTMGVFGSYTDWETAANVLTGTNNPVFVTPYVRQALSATTNVYGVALATFTVSTLNATGHLHCRKNPLQG